MAGENRRARVVATLNGWVSVAAGAAILGRGGAALDAVEAVVRGIEDNPDDWSVGLGGFPNFMGEVELDASIMDGRTLAAGAVAGVRRHKNPVSVARRVMEKTPHVFLIGDGADRFADAEGFEPCDLLTPRMRETYAKVMRGEKIELWPVLPGEPPDRTHRYGDLLVEVAKERQGWKKVFSAEMRGGTCNAMALDRRGDVACAVSTSGLALKMPGRVGDSPVPGAGNYADNRHGAAACTGNGELCLRLCSARTAVHYLAEGMGPREAAERCIRDFASLGEPDGGFYILVMDRRGETWMASNVRAMEYFVMDEGDAEPRRVMGSRVQV
ncbi:MAG: isoaspartyl peptidase/L-asparaginase [Planctomycetes bacterium]|jgi:beta-aspartyl-peptidase (threonine type)|nr:isoaspartyl peptidase/L-asparaginase [Planctomycetota bacterium]